MSTLLAPDTKKWEKTEELPNILVFPSEEDSGIFAASPNRMVYYPNSSEAIPVGSEALKQLGSFIDYPYDFVKKLPMKLQAQIINERMEKTVNKRFSMAGVSKHGKIEDEQEPMIHTVLPSWREFAQPDEYVSSLRNFHNKAGIFEGEPEFKFDQSKLKLTVSGSSIVREKISAVVGDELKFGYEFEYFPGFFQQGKLKIVRLICLNGMTSEETVFSWKAKNFNTKLDQLAWANMQMVSVIGKAPMIAQKARIMSETIIQDPEEALITRMKAMGISSKFQDAVFSAFSEEKGNTEWALLNALTRFSTHNPELTEKQRAEFSASAGDWVKNFDMVTMRLPRKVAVTIAGAEIIVEDDGAELN